MREDLKDRAVSIPNLTYAEFELDFSDMVSGFLKEITERVVTKGLNNAVLKYLYEFYRRSHCSSGYETGIVFLGFGETELFPVVQEWIFDGRTKDHIRLWSWRSMDLNNSASPTGVIIAFAQRDMAHLFMEGISPNYVTFFLEILKGVLNDKADQVVDKTSEAEKIVEGALQNKENEMIMSKVKAAFSAMKQMEVVNPLMGAIRALPREEMMAMAEAFVELTSMRRKVDSNLQTVGGPVDVAFISKGDGFVWGKRKLYFDSDLNGDYFRRRAKRLL